MKFKEGNIVNRFGRNQKFRVLGQVNQLREITDKYGTHLVAAAGEYRIQASSVAGGEYDGLITLEHESRLEFAE